MKKKWLAFAIGSALGTLLVVAFGFFFICWSEGLDVALSGIPLLTLEALPFGLIIGVVTFRIVNLKEEKRAESEKSDSGGAAHGDK